MDDINMFKHKDLRSYIRNPADEALQKNKAEIISSNSGIGLFFEIVDNLLNQVKPDLQKTGGLKELTFTDIDDLLPNLMSGEIPESEAGDIIKHLYHSPQFYSKFFVKIKQLNTALNEQDIDLPAVEIKSDKQLLAEMGIINGSRIHPKYTFAEKVFKKLKNSAGRINEIVFGPGKALPRLAVVVAVFIIMLTGSYLGTAYYNTSYKLNIAEKLIRENYRVYIEGEARLSGGYKSTGIEQIMSGEEEGETYLEKAKLLSDDILKYDARIAGAYMLAAKIYCINGEFNEADSMLKLHEKFYTETSAEQLNNLGVIGFKQAEWPAATKYFSSAVNRDSTFKEAYYNLALTYIELDSIQDAGNTLDKYLEFETDEGWRNAALRLLSGLKSSGNNN